MWMPTMRTDDPKDGTRRPRVGRILLAPLAALFALWLVACNTTTPPVQSVVSVKIVEPNRAMTVGETFTFTAEVAVLGGASKAVTWSSSDTSVATVTAAGVVTAVAEGTATVTATSVGLPKRSDTVNITVVPAGPHVVSVKIDQGDRDVHVSDTLQLTATVVVVDGASTDVTWSTDAPAIATVSPAGLVTAVAEGTAVITATSVGLPVMRDSVTILVMASGPAGGPTISAFAGAVVAGSQAQLTWTVTGAQGELTLSAVNPTDPTDAVELGKYPATSTGATVALPDSGHQRFVLSATNPTATATRAVAPLANVVLNEEDYDVYDLRGAVPEDEVPGSFRSVLAAAEPGSIIGFAADVTRIELPGVDLIPVPGGGEGVIDAHVILREDVTVSGPVGAPVTLHGTSSYEPGDLGDPFTYESRVMYVAPGVTATIENLVISGGTFIYSGAGIFNAGDLTVRSTTITDNRAFGTGGGVRTAAGSTLTMVDSTISDSRAETLDDEIDRMWDIRGAGGEPAVFGGVNGWGGGLYNEGTATLTNTTIGGNFARQGGGGVYNLGTLTLNASAVTDNVADHVTGYTDGRPADTSWGGGVANYATLTFTGGSITGNLAADQGGGLFHGENATSALSGLAITGNTAGLTGNPGFGGGILQRFFTGEQDRMTRSDVTVTGNVPDDYAPSDRGLRPAGAGQALPAGTQLDGLKFR